MARTSLTILTGASRGLGAAMAEQLLSAVRAADDVASPE